MQMKMSFMVLEIWFWKVLEIVSNELKCKNFKTHCKTFCEIELVKFIVENKFMGCPSANENELHGVGNLVSWLWKVLEIVSNELKCKNCKTHYKHFCKIELVKFIVENNFMGFQIANENGLHSFGNLVS